MSEFILVMFFAFALGTIVGSFLNVCIYRIPAEKSIVSPPSSCPACGHRIRWFENVPILSYLFLRGRCSACRLNISLRYPAVEALTGLLFVLTFYYFGFSSATVVYMVFVAALVVITFIDLDHQIIPDVISLPGILVGFASSFFIPWLTWYDSIFGILLGGGSLLAVAWIYEKLTGREGMGGGDIKLLAMFGAFLGWQAVFPVIFLASLAGTLVGVPLMLVQKGDTRLAIPFGPFLAVAAIVYLFWGQMLIGWYLGLL
ncbi:prepilin peptidase [Pelovirga terrestris]|uniref:Prepilin leader peptidase/N-methyltransferase n=1 Tax=Pelovirga terrestris TaxID=2771352 RepID=A0A8J6QNC1_9BACT|nr:A24 family peptidase [Pelovirga terrestris]MBD1399416.1 prepilin peptidase [Pelovirga terrestris]